MHRLLPNDFHVVERSPEQQQPQPQQGAFDGEHEEIEQHEEEMEHQAQEHVINQEIHEPQQQSGQRRNTRGPQDSGHLTQYTLRNCCRVFDAMEKTLGSNELLMDSVLHYMHYR